MEGINELLAGLGELEAIIIRLAVLAGVVITCAVIVRNHFKHLTEDASGPKRPPKRRNRRRRNASRGS